MGLCLGCCKPEYEEGPETPDPEERRRRQEAAALKRQREDEGRGLQNADGMKRKKLRIENAERKALKDRESGGGGLKWTVG